VQTIKNLVKKTKQSHSDLCLALLDLRNTPRDDVIGSPAQRLMGRRTRTSLPTNDALLQPKSIKPTIVKGQLEMYRTKQKHYYDKGTKPLPIIKPGNAVRVKTSIGWKPAEYVRIHDRPRSYVVKAGDQARQYRRNRTMLMKTAENPHSITPRATPPRVRIHTPQVRSLQEPQIVNPNNVLGVPQLPPLSATVRPPDAVTAQNQTTTRSGRSIRRSKWFDDYKCE